MILKNKFVLSLPQKTKFEKKPNINYLCGILLIMSKRKGNPALVKGMESLNPAGRPKGSVNKYTALARELMSERSAEIVERVINKAMEGDVHCLKMCMDRILPVQKAIDSNRTKNDAQVIINVSSIESIEQKASEYEEAELVEPEEKSDDEVVVNIDTSPMAEKFDS